MKKDGTINNLIWKFSERILAQIVSTIVSIILARLLFPSDYGVIAIVMIFITIANVLVSDGFGSALIQKKGADALDFSSVLYFNIVFSLILYAVLFFSAPAISSFYGENYEVLTPVLRVLGLRIIISGVNSVQHAYISKKMIFRKFFWSTLIGTIISAIVGITLAYRGYGVWALVFQYLINTFIDTIVLSIVIRKKPLLSFSFSRLKELLKYGWKVLGTSMLITGYQELRALLIGKVYSSEDLAYFDKGKQFPYLIVTNINASIGAVLFPKMSSIQDDKEKIKELTRKSISFGSYIICPMMIGMCAIANIFVPVLLTEKWIPCIHLMQLFCLIYMFHPLHTANAQVYKATGRSDIYLIVELIKKAIELVVLFSVLWISVDAIIISMAVLTVAFTFVNAFPNKKIIGYKFSEQLIDLLPAILMSAMMGCAVFCLGYLPIDNKIVILIIQVFSGIIIYIFLSIVTRNKEFKFILSLLRETRHRKVAKND